MLDTSAVFVPVRFRLKSSCPRSGSFGSNGYDHHCHASASAYASAPPSRVHSGNHSQCCDHRIGSSKRTCAPGGRQRRHPCVCAGRLLPAPDRHRRSATHVRQSRRRSRTRRAVPPRRTGRCAYARAAASTCAMTGARRSYRATAGRSGVSDWQLAERSDGCRCPRIRARPRRWTYVLCLCIRLCKTLYRRRGNRPRGRR
jgi:hypothetical protein